MPTVATEQFERARTVAHRIPPARMALSTGVVLAVGAAGAGAVVLGELLDPPEPVTVVRSPHPVAALSFLLMGALVIRRRPHNRIGWLFVATGLATGLVAVAASWAHLDLFWWLNQWLPAVAFGLMPVTMLLFPDGRTPAPRWRPVLWLGFGGTAVAAAAMAAAVGLSPQIAVDFARPDPTGGRATAAFTLARIAILTIPVTGTLAVVALVQRWRHEHGDVREQIKLLGLGAAAVPVSIVLDIVGIAPAADALIAAAVPIAASAAILKYRLYDLDVFVNRSVVYGVLTVLLAGVYVGTVTVAGAVLGEGWGSPAIATGAVALLFQPLRLRIQRWVSRLLFGVRDDPYSAVSTVSRILEPALEPSVLFPRLAENIAASLDLPYVGIEAQRVDGRSEVLAEYGRNLVPPEQFRLVHNGAPVGRMLASPRSVGGSFTRREQSLLKDMAQQVAAAVHTVRLADDLRSSRARLVIAREDERRRLRRDLHDGLGPALAGAAMQIASTRRAVSDEQSDILGRAEDLVRACIDEIREIVLDLRPEVLESLGLMGAIRQIVQRFDSKSDLRFAISQTSSVSELPAAVEVAAYRIVGEALANVVRHSGAHWCEINVAGNRSLEIEIVDDGSGIPEDFRPGVGLASMRERAEELGGRFDLATGPDGTRVRVSLPVEV